MNAQFSKGKFPLNFFLLVFIITIPFYALGFITEHFLPKNIPANIPISALAAFNPLIAALIVTYREKGKAGVKNLLGRVLDYGRCKNKIWYLPVFGLLPFLMILDYLWMRLEEVPMPAWEGPVFMAPVLLMVFFIFAIGEEAGWTGYAIDPLQDRWGAFNGAVLLAFLWLLWHFIPFVQTHHSTAWLLWQCVQLILFRILTVWLYNNTGKSLFTAISFHAVNNLSWILFPNYGSHYDPFYFSVLLAITVAIVLFLWDSRTFTRNRYA